MNRNREHSQADQDQQHEQARCDWDFHLSTVVSPTTRGGGEEVSDILGAIELDPSDRLLATGGISRKIRIYALTSLLPPQAFGAPVLSLDHSAACDFFICTPAKLSSLRFRPDAAGHVIGAADYDGVVTEYDLARRTPVSERDEHGGRRVWSLDYSGAHHLAASASDDGSAHVWDTRAGPTAAVLRPGGAAPLCAVRFGPEGGPPWLGVGCADRRAHVYDVRAMAAGPVATFGGHRRAVTYVRFAGDGKVVTSGADGAHRMWDPAEGRELRVFRGHVSARSFVGMAVWGGGGLIASGSESNEVFVYDLRWGEPVWVKPFGPGTDRTGFVSAVSWREAAGGDGECALIAGGSNGVLQAFAVKRRED